MADRGDLINFYQKDQSFTFKQGIKVVLGAAKGLAYMHSMPTPVVHRDIKSSNIMVLGGEGPRDASRGAAAGTSGDNVHGKVGDCGESRRVDLSATMTRLGTPLWAAVCITCEVP